MTAKTDISVYLDSIGMIEPEYIGTLSAQQTKGRKSFSFSYDRKWIASNQQLLLDPDILPYAGLQYPNGKENFGVFSDSMPDTWGRTLMKRREGQQALEENRSAQTLYDIDFLLGVHDASRMGALRFKLDPKGPFLDNDPLHPTPPWASIRELQYGAAMVESHEPSKEALKWLELLIAPGSSLGGARPKANILDEENNLWIAKFPSKNDTIDKAAWEYLAYSLAVEAGITMSSCKLEQIAGPYRTFFTKRFDRNKSDRIHFASAMTMTGKSEELVRDESPSYLDIVEFIQFSGSEIAEDLHQLWRRIVFNIAVSNTDDHLRNHGFLLTPKGWRLSPAFDINPSIDKNGLSLTIDMDNNALDFDLARSVGEYFRLKEKEMDRILQEVTHSVSNWKKVATKIGISRGEQQLMASAFRI